MQHVLYRMAVVLAGLAFACASWGQSAQSFPSRPITFIHGFPPGTILDAVSRIVSVEMAKSLGQPIVLDFKPGGNGIVGGRYVMNSRPDGYTLYYGNATSFHPLFIAENAIYAGKDFAPVSTVVSVPYFFFSTAKIQPKTFKELVAYSHNGPDAVKFGATSQTIYLIMQMLKDRNGLESRGIPYKSSGQMVTAVLVDEVETTIGAIQPFLAHVKSGAIRPLFVATAKRSPLMPDVPTAAEAGVPNFEVVYNYGLWAPSATPKDIVQKLATTTAVAVKAPVVVEQIHSIGGDPVGSTPEEALHAFEADTKFWTEAARLSNFKPQ